MGLKKQLGGVWLSKSLRAQTDDQIVTARVADVLHHLCSTYYIIPAVTLLELLCMNSIGFMISHSLFPKVMMENEIK